MRTFIENYLHFMKNCNRPHYEKLKPLRSGFIENSTFEKNRDPCDPLQGAYNQKALFLRRSLMGPRLPAPSQKSCLPIPRIG